MTNLNDFKNKLFEAANQAGFDEYEIYLQNGATVTVNVFDQEVSQFTNASSSGLSFRGKFGGKIGYSSSEKIDESIIQFLVSSAKSNAEILETVEDEELYAGDAAYPEVKGYSEELSGITSEDKIKAALVLEKSAKDADSRISAVPYCMLANSETEILIANSKGLDLTKKSNAMYTFVHCQASEDGKAKTGGKFAVVDDFKSFDPAAVGNEAAGKALQMLGAEPVPGGKYKILIDNDAASSFLATFFGAFSAESAQKGFSLLKGKLDTKIAGEAVTIVDDPLIPGALGSTPFDSEGVASYKKTVVDKGVFKTFLHNTKTARKDGVKPTGNGFKPDYRTSVAIGGTNFFIQPGNLESEELFKEAEGGLLITSFAGLHSGANSVSGEFSLQAEGFVIENGKKGRPVEQITVSGNFFTLLNDVIGVGCDLEFKMPSYIGNIASPSLLIKELDVSGS